MSDTETGIFARDVDQALLDQTLEKFGRMATINAELSLWNSPGLFPSATHDRAKVLIFVEALAQAIHALGDPPAVDSAGALLEIRLEQLRRRKAGAH